MQSQLHFARSTSALLALLALSGASFAQNPLTSFCSPGVAGVIPCPCSNPPAGLDRGCDNSSATGGASLSASGVAALTGDTLVFTTSGERPTATSIVLQATSTNPTGVAFGQGVRCVSNNLLRLYVKNAVGGSISAPVGTDLSVSARSAALGDAIFPGQSRTYAVYYRDPVVLGGCVSGGTFNITQSGSVTWVYASTPPVPALVPIQAGTFQMGSNAAGGPPYFGGVGPVHSVTISNPFWIGVTEVTQGQYQALMGTNPSQNVALNNPVERVSWHDAQAYCAALTTQQTALGHVPAGYTFRLPTEAEWEYACRAGTTTEFNGGVGLFCSEARFGYSHHSNTDCGSTGPVAVASYLPNSWGLYDMHGNVREWCQDSNAAYLPFPVTDPLVTGGPTRIVRGGNYYDSSNSCRSALRYGLDPNYADGSLGFRVVLAPVPNPTTPIPSLVSLQPGTFQMGSNAAGGGPYFGDATTLPVHQVLLSYMLWMSVTEVTQAQYQALMGTNPSQFVAPNNPVERVSWNDAQAYCAALTAQQTALGNVPAGYTFRLPTEAEWEYACRAGTSTEFNSGSGLLCSEARFGYSYHSNSTCGSSGPVTVASYVPNNWGLYDMHGNVREWCLDTYVGYTIGAVTDPYIVGGFLPVVRGGAWDSNSNMARSAYRSGSVTASNKIGFRIVLAPILTPSVVGQTAPVPALVAIQPGTFQMGSNAASGAPYYNEFGYSPQPVHSVTISYNFWMGEKEVTQSQYQAAMGTNPSQFVGLNNPVERVNWIHAQDYCAALTTQQTALGNVPPGYAFRLPTEAEWEYACRAGTTTEFNTGTALYCSDAQFYYSFHYNSSCNSNNTVAVGSYSPNSWGLYDMHGNVSEWCLDSEALYASGSVTDPFVTGGPTRIIRGGGWWSDSQECRSAWRYAVAQSDIGSGLGFRVVLAPVLVP